MRPSVLIGDTSHDELRELLKKRHCLTVSGCSNATAKSLFISHILGKESPSMVIVTENREHAIELSHWDSFFEVPAQLFLLKDSSVSVEELGILLKIMKGQESFVIDRATWDMEVPSLADFEEQAILLCEGTSINFSTLFDALIAVGYTHSPDTHLSPGQYRRTGDTLALFPIGEPSEIEIRTSFDRIDAILAHGNAKKELTIYPLIWQHVLPLSSQVHAKTVLVLDEQEEITLPEENTCLKLSSFPEGEDLHAHVRYLSVLKFYTLQDFLNDVKDKLNQGWALVIVTKRAEELEAILQEENISLSVERHAGSITIIPADSQALLPHSIQNPDLKCALITDREIFSLKKGVRQRSVQRLALDFITSLQPKDYVVHMEHGIGQFEGMQQKVVDNLEREYLAITYAENDKLFVPVDQADKLSKYVYEEGHEPVLTRLGSMEWKRASSKVTEETRLVAKELLDVYAKRAKARGHAFPKDSEDQRKFDEAFPYTETPGQLKAIEDIKHDMESPHPMDRLVCGDVGFGKTEVAMRAAFKAVQGGKQVALLSPITILADQHYHSLIQRVEGFPIRVEMLSRFRSAAEQKEILVKIKKGEVDIVVGTHRLLQDDIIFKDLGLLIIDEEQRFGVKQKEKLKSLRASIDILTLTATPIPRTLNLGLHKLRDITTITTPPPGRLPIISEVRKYSDGLIRDAITKEVKRGGQVYVLHNRVETIDAFAMKLRALIPNASFIVTHGQLKPEILEERIFGFKEGKYNVLVSSTIIENGIDLPKANTLIVNEAEKFGLSQLYQLRGRVGRSTTQAYAYFLYHSQRLKDDAKKRLRAIVEATELGSGFQISMRDLEIRGAGEILGASQSGNMQTVGVSHYLKLLKNAVEELKAGDARSEEEMPSTIEITLPFESLIPSYYVTDEQEKISVYQKLAGSEDEKMLAEFTGELIEEYGPLPQQVTNLLDVLCLKMACRRAGVLRVKSEIVGKDREVILTLSSRITAPEIMQLLKKNPQWRITGTQLKIREDQLMKFASSAHWLPSLTEQIVCLMKRKG